MTETNDRPKWDLYKDGKLNLPPGMDASLYRRLRLIIGEWEDGPEMPGELAVTVFLIIGEYLMNKNT
jgi:hypothetical protein